MNLGLVSLNGYRIKKLKSFILRCRACFKTTPIMTKEFCPACGNKMLHKVAVSVDENGEQVLHINWQRLANKRGLKHSLPAPKGGKHAVVEKLFEDQPIPQNRMAKVHTGGFLMSSVYYCHQCRNQVPLRNTDMICGVCGGEFLEQITPPPRVIPHAPFSHFRQPPGRGAHFHHHHHHPPAQQPHVQQGSSQNAPENFFQSLMGMFNSLPSQPPASSQSRSGSGSNTPSNGRAQGPQAITFSLDQAMQMHPILGQVLSSLGDPHMQVRIHIGDDRDGTMHGPFGDYVWGENGMDRIVTQLLNQMDGTVRPVGLTEQQINRLPIIKVSEQHVKKDTQCTTCFEDFKLGWCSHCFEDGCGSCYYHIFHTQCVVPWLQQRPSCPICRQEVNASLFPEPAPGAPTVSSLEAKR
ncbi:Nin one binding Zn-ribbon like protein [Ostertagia ostertagi]